MKKVSAKDLSAVISMSNLGKKQDKKDLLSFYDSMPGDNPVKSVVEKVRDEASKQGRTLDLADLPDNHPLMLSLAEAKMRFDENQDKHKEIEIPEKQPGKPIRAKKAIDKGREERDKRRAEYDDRKKIADAKINEINMVVNSQVDSLSLLFGKLNDVAKDVAGDSMTVGRIDRLKRLVLAARNGLNQSLLREWRG